MPKGRRPLTPAGMISPHPLFFLILRRVLRFCPQHSAHFYNKSRGTTLSQENREKNRPPPASRSARVRRRAPFHGGRLACRAVAPYHVVKMRDTRSLRVFNENYPLSRSFSLRVVGVLYPHTPLRGYYTLALPCYLFIAHSNARFVKELRRKICLWGYYTPTPPSYYFIPISCIRFVKEQRRKISRATPVKIFAPLTTTENNIINTRAERSPAPRLSCCTLRRSGLRRTVFPA